MSEFKNGTVRISNDIIDFIVKSAAEEVNGVFSVSENSSSSKNNGVSKVKTKILNSDIFTNIEVVLNIGHDVLDTVKEIQKNVKNQVETMTGLSVKEVNVKVDKIVL
ncbi:MAG: Asp23/Gls24 family envelope stress response protein [Peptoniphilaceae bacterium]|nr:Asp23/Gls24 family envelope stress response protein [Peptoniphilaceae bacterium]MDD7382860.1 Asp23/Gls24 family envelope stress response protein [Peptoniphilaceae bacterium]MDY3738181.1 Asp23/Gls24 family envelope stress response protein [Peptoniphilaceae bacterium]